MKRVAVLVAALLPLGLAAQQPAPGAIPAAERQRPFDVREATIPQIQAALSAGRVTSRELVQQYLARIAQFDPQLHAVMALSPTALTEADALDRERSQGRVRGPLHGIPIALKDNIQAGGMPTSGGTLALKQFIAPYEATLTTQVKQAGAIVMAKTHLTELANWVAGPPTPMPAGYNAIRGFVMNAYDPRTDPRPGFNDGRPVLGPGSSSSGVGTAMSLWAANVGTETSGSILSPSNQNMLVGIKPTVGLVSRWGVIPITLDKDTPGPMARTVEDAAILLGAMVGDKPDPHDPATRKCTMPRNQDYRPYLKRDGLRGARIGIPRAFFFDAFTVPGTSQPRGGLTPAAAVVMSEAIDVLRREGAVVVDPANIPSVTASNSAQNAIFWNSCNPSDHRKGPPGHCSMEIIYSMKRDFNAWLATLGSTVPVKSLGELRRFNVENAYKNAIRYGQSMLDMSDAVDLTADRARYAADRAKGIELGGTRGIRKAMLDHRLDAILFPGALGASLASKPGYPTVIVPFGLVPNAPNPPFPAGFNAKPIPLGVSFTGLDCSEPRLIEIAYAFEQATKRRVPPDLSASPVAGQGRGGGRARGVVTGLQNPEARKR